MSEEKHDESDVFEIIDFTTASPWETLALDIEKHIRAFGLAADGDVRDTSTNVREVTMEFGGRQFAFIHWKKTGCTSENEKNLSLEPLLGKATTLKAFKDGGFDSIPSVMAALLSIPQNSLCLSGHTICQLFGVTEFLLVLARSTEYSDKISRSEARMISSALSVALSTTGCALSGFTQVDESKKQHFIGCSMVDGMFISFDTVSTIAVPKAYSHLSGLLGLFRSKFRMVDRSERILISARFTFTLKNWFDDWMPSNQDDFDFGALFSDQYLMNPLDAIPFGLKTDPLRAINLYTTWPHFHENTVTENAVHSELDPKLAPNWTLKAESNKVAMGRLASILSSFVELFNCNDSWQSILESQGSSSPSAADRDVKDVFKNLTRSPQNALSGEKLKSMVGKTIRATTQKVEKFCKLEDEDLDAIWLRLFGEDDWNPLERTNSSSGRQRKGAPKHSFVDELAITVALVNGGNGFGAGLSGVATLWKEILQDIEYNYWEKLEPIPRVGSADPDMRHTLIFQKLQMINTCIKRQDLRNQLIAQRKELRAKESKTIDNADSFEKSNDDESDSDEFESADDMSNRSDSGSDNEDEYYLAPEDDDGLFERVQQLKIEVDKDIGAVTDSSGAIPLGVKSIHSTLKLLKTGAAMHIPQTQEEGPMTEDMVEQKQELMTEMGTSEEAVQARIQMQSMSLRSDMMAFKAANPGCIIEDFVRWHSPRDYISENNDGTGCLSERMRQPGNLWHQIWSDSEPRPVNRQRSLFDSTKESLSAIRYLSTITPSQLAWQLLPNLLRSVEQMLHLKNETLFEGKVIVLSEKIDSLSKMCNGLGYDFHGDKTKANEIIQAVSEIEMRLYLAQSLANKLGDDEDNLIGRLASEVEVPLLKDSQRAAIFDLFTQESNSLGPPHIREYTFRLISKQPTELSRPGANRMYCSLADDRFRVAAAFSEDRVFGRL